MKQLPASTVRLLTSTQVITGSASILKELIENALDAQATSLDIRLDNYGLDRLEVRDNGAGISVSDIPYAAKKHYTSKIACHEDLLSLHTLGFRGEALGAIAAISEMEIVTKCAGEIVGRGYRLDGKGDIVRESNVPTVTGTSVAVSHMYKAVPVRRQYYSAPKRKKEELKLITDFLMAYGALHYQCRFVLKHNKSVIWQKNSTDGVYSSLCCVLTPSVVTYLQHYRMEIVQGTTCDMYLGLSDADTMLRSTNDRMFLYINQRYIRDKELEKLIRTYACKQKPQKYPTCFLHLKLPPSEVDVNLEPDKTKVFLTNKSEMLEKLEEHLASVYGVLEAKGPSTNQATGATTERANASADITEGTQPCHTAADGLLAAIESISDCESDTDVFLSCSNSGPKTNTNEITNSAVFSDKSMFATRDSAVASSTLIEDNTSQQVDLFSLSSFDSDDSLPPLPVNSLTPSADDVTDKSAAAPTNSSSLPTADVAHSSPSASAACHTNKQSDGIENKPCSGADTVEAVTPVAGCGDVEVVETPTTSSAATSFKQKSLTSYNVAGSHDNGTTSGVDGDRWVRGQLSTAQQPVRLASCCQMKNTHNQNGGDKSLPDDSFGSMIREETIPDSYRKFVTSSAAKRRKLNSSVSESQPLIKAMFNKSKMTPQPKRTNTSTAEVMFSLKSLQVDYKNRLDSAGQKLIGEDGSSRQFVLCGSARTTTGAIVLGGGDTLLAFNPFVFKEQEVYSRLLQEYEVPSQPVSIQLVQGMISPQAWLSLTSLPVDEWRDQTVMNDTLHLNGYSLQRQSSEEYRVTAAAGDIPGYGTVPDLEDILLHLTTNISYRPTKVLHHIQSEVIRLVRSIDRFESAEVLDMLDKVDKERDITEIACPIHSRHMFTSLSRLTAG